MADDVFTTTGREYEVIGYHRAVGATAIKIIRKLFGSIGNIFKFIFGSKAIVEPEPEPATMMSSIYDSISSAMSSSNSTSAPMKTAGQKPVTRSAPLRTGKTTTLPKATSRGALGKKSIMEDLAKSSSSGLFDDIQDTGVSIAEKLQSYLPDTSKLAKLLPTLVAGLVFTTAGTIVGYLYNSELAATATSYVNYYLGGDSEGTPETDSFYDAAATTDDSSSGSGNFASTAVPVTPGRF